jgi:ferredoxin-nitrate reductase
VTEPAKVGGIEQGLVFIPFHYGYWDNDDRKRAANELTLSEWDPVSKQPHFKYGAVKISKVGEGILHTIGEAFETIKEKLKPQEA